MGRREMAFELLRMYFIGADGPASLNAHKDDVDKIIFHCFGIANRFIEIEQAIVTQELAASKRERELVPDIKPTPAAWK